MSVFRSQVLSLEVKFSPLDIQGLEATSSGSRLGSSQEKLGIQLHPFVPPSSPLWAAELRSDSPKVCLFSANISGFVFSNCSCFSWGISRMVPFPVSLGSHRTGTFAPLPQEPGAGGRSEGVPGAGAHPDRLCLPVNAAQGDSGHRCDSGRDCATFEPSGHK